MHTKIVFANAMQLI